jgi:hypothetical protein
MSGVGMSGVGNSGNGHDNGSHDSKRQLKLGAVTMGVGGPGQHYLWLDEDIPGDASVNVNWYIEQARLERRDERRRGRGGELLPRGAFRLRHPLRPRS